jgi:hypothetical protein
VGKEEGGAAAVMSTRGGEGGRRGGGASRSRLRRLREWGWGAYASIFDFGMAAQQQQQPALAAPPDKKPKKDHRSETDHLCEAILIDSQNAEPELNDVGNNVQKVLKFIDRIFVHGKPNISPDDPGLKKVMEVKNFLTGKRPRVLREDDREVRLQHSNYAFPL